jgi:hypothetical protein
MFGDDGEDDNQVDVCSNLPRQEENKLGQRSGIAQIQTLMG